MNTLLTIALAYVAFMAVLNLTYTKYSHVFKKHGIEISGIMILWRLFKKELLASERMKKIGRRIGPLLDVLIGLSILSLGIALKIYFENILGIMRSLASAQSPAQGVVTPVVPIIPGVTISLSSLPMLILVIAIAALVHEGMHAFVGLLEGIKIKSSGIALITIILAPFVEIDEENFGKIKLRSKLRILSAGVGGNVVLAGVSIVMLLLALPLFFNIYPGLYVVDIVPNTPAQQVNMQKDTVIIAINNTRLGKGKTLLEILLKPQVLYEELNSFKLKGGTLVLTLMDPKNTSNVMEYVIKRANITEPIGVILYPYVIMDPKSPFAAMLGYNLQTFLIWSFALNLGLAAVNATPIFVTDGGKAFDEILKEKLGERGVKVSRLTQAFFVIILLINIFSSLMLYMP